MGELNLLNSNLDLSVLDNLSPEQRELALSILQEYAQTGDSEAYSKLILEDYAETPVDILTFVDDYNYLGNAWHDAEGNSKLYPYWRKELVKIFPDNFTTTVNNGIFSGSRGRGKTEVALLIASYLLHRILCLKDPIAYYHLKPTEKLVFAFMNIKLALAEEIGISKFQNTLQSSPWFMSHGELEGRTKKIWVPQKYNNQVAPAMMEKFGYKNIMEIPKLDKIVINMGVGNAKENPKGLEKAVEEMEMISGQKPVITRARKSVANFKLREGMPIGAKVTLRSDKMYYFLDKLVSVTLPRVRDFRGVNPNAFDGRGNYALGVKEQIIFPEIEYDKIDQVRGMDVIFVTTAKTDEEARELLKLLGMPFSK